jgi:hypothetical protein
MKSISKHYAIRLSVPDPDYAARLGISCPKFSDRVQVYKKACAKSAHQLAEREHLNNLKERFPKHLVSTYPNYKKELGMMTRVEASKKFAKVPYTLD